MFLNDTILDINVNMALGDVPTFDGMNLYRDISITEVVDPPGPGSEVDPNPTSATHADIAKFIDCRNYKFLILSMFPLTEDKQYSIKIHRLDTKDFKVYSEIIAIDKSGKQKVKIKTDSMPVAVTLVTVTELGAGDETDLVRINYLMTNLVESDDLILVSPNGHRWQLSVDNGGVISTTDLDA